MAGNAVAFRSPLGVAVNIPTTTETVVATVNVTTPLAGQRIALRAMVDLTPGTSTTSATLRIRRGSTITDTVVQASPVFVVAAGANIALALDAVDQPGEYNGPYVLTVTQGAATANGTAAVASINADVL